MHTSGISSHKVLSYPDVERKESGAGILLGGCRGKMVGGGKDIEKREAHIITGLGKGRARDKEDT